MLRAYRQLSAEDLVELRCGRGATISGDLDRGDLYRLADELLAEAARLGVSGVSSRPTGQPIVKERA